MYKWSRPVIWWHVSATLRLDFQHLRTFLTLVFIRRDFYSSNNVVRCMAKLFSVSVEFRLLCAKVGIPLHRIDVTPIHVLRCSVYKNFALNCFYSFKPTVLHVHVFSV